MILYNLYSGGVVQCSGTTRKGKRCKRSGYTTDRSRGYRCKAHGE